MLADIRVCTYTELGIEVDSEYHDVSTDVNYSKHAHIN